ncbi:MAG: nicotinate (nicotinamide) nucleotide adenylyltransferase [Flavobacteriales bacterium]|nr:nicotinate (nicotinamide) nucleotide adenylyltransferase [Flavobacteriales bacterium]
MKVGCLFGTFDPPHRGHLQVAEWMRDHMGLDEVWFMVTPQNPFKLGHPLSPEEDRLHMVQLAILGRRGLKASDLEFALPRPSYTVDTLACLRTLYPDHSFALLMGGDNLLGFSRWKGPLEILAHHRVLVYPRPGGAGITSVDPAIRAHTNLVFTEAPLMDVSATEIRDLLANGQGVGDRVPVSVQAYIRDRQLYTA